MTGNFKDLFIEGGSEKFDPLKIQWPVVERPLYYKRVYFVKPVVGECPIHKYLKAAGLKKEDLKNG